MIEKIEIIINYGLFKCDEIEIDCINKKIIQNKKEKEIKEKEISELIKLISSWDKEYNSSNEIDSEEFYIRLLGNNIEENYHGKGVFPTNYSYFKEIIGEINGR